MSRKTIQTHLVVGTFIIRFKELNGEDIVGYQLAPFVGNKLKASSADG